MTTPGGTSATSPADQFTYTRPCADSHGPEPDQWLDGRRHAGDDHRHGFTGATAVDFGTTPATNLTVVSDTDHGRQPGGYRHGGRDRDDARRHSATSAADQFTYAARRRSRAEPDQRAAGRRHSVTITGTGSPAPRRSTSARRRRRIHGRQRHTITADSPAGTGVWT